MTDPTLNGTLMVQCLRGFLLSMVLVLGWGTAHANQVLSWEDCVRIAMENNAQILAAKANLRALDFQKDGTYSNFLPQLNAFGTYNRSRIEQEQTGQLPVIAIEGDNYVGGLSANLNLFSGFQDMGRLWQAQANERAAEANLKAVKAQVSLDLKSAFEGLVYAKEYQKLTEQIISRRRENLGLVELRFQGGRENKGSVLLSKAYLEQAKYDDLQARNAQRVARRQLARAIGYDDFTPFDIQGSVPTQEPSATLPVFESLALDTPEFKLAKAQHEAAEATVVVARSPFFPTVDLNGSVRKSGEEYFPDQTKISTLGVSINFPFFSGGRDYFNTRSSIELRSAAQSQRFNVTRQMLARLEQSFAFFTEAVAKFHVDTVFREATSVRAEIARNKYNNGLLTFEDWDVIESDLILRQKNYLSSKRDRVIAEANWEQAQGKGAFSEIEQK